MPTKRKVVDKPEQEVTAYTMEESANLAARTLALSTNELGIYALGYMSGMAMADPQFRSAPVHKDIGETVAVSCVAQACSLLKKEYEKILQATKDVETAKGEEWVKGKIRHINTMISLGDEIEKDIENFVGDKLIEQAKEHESRMAKILKEGIIHDDISKKDN